MILQFYLTILSDYVLTVVIDSSAEVYWQASDLLKIFKLRHNTYKIMKDFFVNVKRARDISAAYNTESYMLTTEQVRHFIAKTKYEGEFVDIFENITSGRAYLHTKEIAKFHCCSREHPFQPRPISVFLESPVTTTTTAEDYPYIFHDKEILSFKLPDLVKLICLSSSHPDTISANQPLPSPPIEYNHLPPSPEISTLPPSPTIENIRLLLSLSPPHPSSPETPTLPPSPSYPPPPSTSFQMEVDEARSFVMEDTHFDQVYKFHAVKATWMSGPASVGFTPFIMPDNENNFYIYIPVKNH